VISRSYAEVFDRSENSREIGEFSQNNVSDEIYGEYEDNYKDEDEIHKKRRLRGGSKNINLFINGTRLDKCNHYTFNKIPLINSILTSTELRKIDEYYGVYNFNHKYLIYFDHKIAGFSSTILLFLFRSSIPSHNVERRDNEFKIRHLNVINFIKNCESCYSHFQYIDVEEPYCPHPPYKSRRQVDNFI